MTSTWMALEFLGNGEPIHSVSEFGDGLAGAEERHTCCPRPHQGASRRFLPVSSCLLIDILYQRNHPPTSLHYIHRFQSASMATPNDIAIEDMTGTWYLVSDIPLTEITTSLS